MGAGASRRSLLRPDQCAYSILFLGEGGVGKSTLCKNLFLTHGLEERASVELDAERNAVIKSLVSQTIDAMQLKFDEIDVAEEVTGNRFDSCRTRSSLQRKDIADKLFADFDTVCEVNARGRFEISKDKLLDVSEQKGSLRRKTAMWAAGHLPPVIGGRPSLAKRQMGMNEDQILLEKALKNIWSNQDVLKLVPVLEAGGGFERSLVCSNAKIARTHLSNIFHPNFQMDERQALHISKPTLSVKKKIGNFDGVCVEVIDVGGKTHFQGEWDMAIKEQKDKVCMICFVVSLSDFRHTDGKGNRMEQSLETWKKLLKNELVTGMSVALIFTQMDSFTAAVQRVPLHVWPRLENAVECAEENDPDKYEQFVLDCIIEMFTSCAKSSEARFMKSILTSGLDVPLVRSNFETIDEYRDACKSTKTFGRDMMTCFQQIRKSESMKRSAISQSFKASFRS